MLGSSGSKVIASAVDDDDDQPPPSAGGQAPNTALAVVSTALANRVHSASRKPPVKAFVELNGDVHTIRVPNLHELSSAADLRPLLSAACRLSGAPELSAFDIDAAAVQYLNQAEFPAMVTDATDVEALRSAKAFRVLADSS